MDEGQLPAFYIGIGASAGGLEAIESFFSSMPADSGFAFVVIQHLSPDHPSLMNELLAKHTSMPIHRAEDGMEVKPNNIYLIQPKKNLTIFHGKLVLTAPQNRKGVNLPIDIFHKSLAEDQKEKAVGIILSGTGSDGTRGVRYIKENGGMVMVQDEASAKFDGMPRSAISTGLADYILSPSEMPNQLLAFASHPPLALGGSGKEILNEEDGLAAIFTLLRDEHGIDFTYYKPNTVLRRIERRLSVNQIKTIRDYVRYLELYPRELSLLFRELLIRVTNFFRDTEVFNTLQEKYIEPVLKNTEETEVRIWIPACSTGEEAYSLAILFSEAQEKLKNNKKVKIFATDIDEESILYAGTGIYPDSVAADIPDKYLAKYFIRKDESHYIISPNLREMVVFAKHNLIKDPPFTNISLISCRNVLIYFQPVLQQRVLDYFTFSLQNQGMLLLGTSETVGDMNEYFIPLEQSLKIYRSTGKIRSHFINGKVQRGTSRNRMPVAKPLQRYGGGHLNEDERLLNNILEKLSRLYFRVAFTVNENNELLQIAGNSEGLVTLPSGRMVNDITKMIANDLSIPVATGLQRIFKKKDEKILYRDITLELGNELLHVDMSIYSLQHTRDIFLAIIVLEEKQTQQDDSEKSVTYNVNQQTQEHIRDLEQELQFSRENLQATIEELETSNEELQATNEELLASNEELQSTNEELQSVNEELYTVNAEHQQKISELTQLNNDMNNLLSSTNIYTLFLDDQFEIRKFTTGITDIFSIQESDIGRPLGDLTNRLIDTDLNRFMEEIQGTGTPVEHQVRTRDGKWFLMKLLPYNITSRISSGYIITFVDISRLKRAEERIIFQAELLENLGQAIVATNTDGKVIFWNRAATSLYQWKEDEVIARDFFDLIVPSMGRNQMDDLMKAMKTGAPWLGEITCLKKDGKEFNVKLTNSPIHDEDKNLVAIISISEDMEDFREIACNFIDSDLSFRNLFHKLRNGIVTLHVNHEDTKKISYTISEGNDAFWNTTGLSKKKTTGKNVGALAPDESVKSLEKRLNSVMKNMEEEMFTTALGEAGNKYAVTCAPLDDDFLFIIIDKQIE